MTTKHRDAVATFALRCLTTGRTIAIRGTTSTEEQFRDGLVVSTPTHTSSGWSGAQVGAFIALVNDVTQSGPAPAVLQLVNSNEETVYVSAVVAFTHRDSVVLSNGSRVKVGELAGVSF